MRWGIATGVTLLCLALLCGAGLAAADEPDGEVLPADGDDYGERAPYVDAGLDQEVRVGDEVLLDGGGTWDDQGDIDHKEWTIETPDGGTVEPACPTCWFTSFRVEETGEYAATLTVRDAEGHENEDTLYVTVRAPESEPETVGDGPIESAVAGGDNDMCWGSHAGDTPESWCSEHADVVDVEVADDRNALENVVFEYGEMPIRYSEYRYDSEGYVVVPIQTFRDEAELVYEAFVGEQGAGGLWGSSDRRSIFNPPDAVDVMGYDPSDNNNGVSASTAVEAMSYEPSESFGRSSNNSNNGDSGVQYTGDLL